MQLSAGWALSAASTGHRSSKFTRNDIFERIREHCGSLHRAASSAPVCAGAENATFDPALMDLLAACEISKCPACSWCWEPAAWGCWRTRGLTSACNCREGPGRATVTACMAGSKKNKRKCICLIMSIYCLQKWTQLLMTRLHVKLGTHIFKGHVYILGKLRARERKG